MLEAYVTCIHAQGKRFEVAAMIPPRTYSTIDAVKLKSLGAFAITNQQQYMTYIEPGPALRMDLGGGEFKEVAKPENGFFPGVVAEAGVSVAVENAQASKKEDRSTILKLLAGPDYQGSDPPESCKGYEDVNKAYHSLFKGSAIYHLASSGLNGQLSKLLEADTTGINNKAAWGKTPLHTSALVGHMACVRVLLDERALVDAIDDDGATPLLGAVYNEQIACQQLLLAANAAVDHADSYGRTALSYSAQQGHYRQVVSLLEEKAAADRAMDDGATPLLLAAEFGP